MYPYSMLELEANVRVRDPSRRLNAAGWRQPPKGTAAANRINPLRDSPIVYCRGSEDCDRLLHREFQ